MGIDDGSKQVGIALVQPCQTKNKCVFKGVLHHRQDVKTLMTQRAGERRYRRSHKRYRKARFNNRSASTRKGRVAPSILQKRQAVVRLVKRLQKWISIARIHLEDVAIDIRALTEGYKPYKWQYQERNRLDENLRKATIMRDSQRCRMCGKGNRMLEVHHIVPRRAHGGDSLPNLITLCSVCHERIKGKETEYITKFQKQVAGKHVRMDYAQHVMQGKTWLRGELDKIAPLLLTNGGTTANRRIDWGLKKTHINDAIAITGLYPRIDVEKEWEIKPKRKKRKMKQPVEVCGLRHGDYASYTDRKGEKWTGYITAMYPEKAQINIQTPTKHLKRANARKSAFVYRFLQFSIF
jgi:hypothetical protein